VKLLDERLPSPSAVPPCARGLTISPDSAREKPLAMSAPGPPSVKLFVIWAVKLLVVAATRWPTCAQGRH
jgi:hypothetical protein